MQLERLLTGDAAGAAALDLADGGVKDRRPGAQRRNKRGLLGVDHALDAGGIPAQLGKLLAERVDRGAGELVQIALVLTGPA